MKRTGQDYNVLFIIVYCDSRYFGCSCRLPLRTALRRKREHFASILFIIQKTYEEKFPKMAKMTKNSFKSPKMAKK
jgi:hypothetical protein